MHHAVIIILLSWLSLGFGLKQDASGLEGIQALKDTKSSLDWNVILNNTKSPFDWGENLTNILDATPKQTYWVDPNCYTKAANSAPNQPQGNFDALLRTTFEMACFTRDSLEQSPVDTDFARVFKILFNHEPDVTPPNTVFEMSENYKRRWGGTRASSFPTPKGPILAVMKDICENWQAIPRTVDMDQIDKTTTRIMCDNVKISEGKRFKLKTGDSGEIWDAVHQVSGAAGMDCDDLKNADGTPSSMFRGGFTFVNAMMGGDASDQALDRSVITICDKPFEYNVDLGRIEMDWQSFAQRIPSLAESTKIHEFHNHPAAVLLHEFTHVFPYFMDDNESKFQGRNIPGSAYGWANCVRKPTQIGILNADSLTYLALMAYFARSHRRNPQTGLMDGGYTLRRAPPSGNTDASLSSSAQSDAMAGKLVFYHDITTPGNAAIGS